MQNIVQNPVDSQILDGGRLLSEPSSISAKTRPDSWSDDALSLRGKVFLVIINGAGLSVLLYSAIVAVGSVAPTWLYLAVLIALSCFFPVKLPVLRKNRESVAIAMGDVFVFTSIFLFGPAVAACVAAVEGLVISLQLKVKTFYKILFNVTHLPLGAFVVGKFFYLMQGKPEPLDYFQADPTTLLLEAGICGFVYFALNTGVVIVAMSLATRKPISSLLGKMSWAAISHFVCAFLGAVIFLSFRQSEFYYVALAAPVILLVHYTYRINHDRIRQTQQHLDEVRALLDEKIEAEKALQRAKDLLETRVLARTSELQEANQKLHVEVEQRNSAQKALAAETERLRVTLRSIADGVITTDRAGRVVLMNSVAESLTGWSGLAASGRDLEEVFQAVDSTGKLSNNLCRGVFESGNVWNSERGDWRLISREGAQRNISHSAAPIRDEQDMIEGVVLVFRDVTEQQRMEQELLKAQKLDSLGILAGGIAHDFNNILSGILLKAQLAQRAIAKKTDPDKFMRSIQDAVQTATSLTQQLLTFARGGSPIKQTASIAELLEESAGFALRGSNNRCELQLPDDLWTADVDKGQISQVLHNLVINAAQSMPDGGTITVEAENVRLDGPCNPGGLAPGPYLRISVRDEGVGIPQENLASIFDPYFSTKSTGHGLGLTTTHSIILRHSGYISAESETGKGSCFCFYLPASSAPPATVEKARPAESGSGRVLVMDDEKQIRDVLVQSLAELGYQTAVSSDGNDAIRKYIDAAIEGEPFDVVIMDLTVPGGMGGQEAVRKLRKVDPEALVVVSSGYSRDPVMGSFREFGFSGVLSKPFRFEDLSQTLSQLMDADRSGTGFADAKSRTNQFSVNPSP